MKKLITFLIALNLIAVGLTACKHKSVEQYELIRPASMTTNNEGTIVLNIALYKKLGDSNHVYMKSAGGNWLGMAK